MESIASIVTPPPPMEDERTKEIERFSYEYGLDEVDLVEAVEERGKEIERFSYEYGLDDLLALLPPLAEKNTPMAPTPEENIPPTLAPTTALAPSPPAAAPPPPPTQRAQVLKRKRGERGLGKQNNKKVKNINPLECMRCGMVGLILHYPKPSPEIDHALIVFQSLFDDSLDLKMCKRCTKTSSNYKDGILNLLKLKV